MGIGGFAGIWAVAAAGGAVVTTIGATIVRGDIGAGLGGLLLLSMAAGIRVNLAAAAVVVWPWERRPNDANGRVRRGFPSVYG
jgi:hypothetical protein